MNLLKNMKKITFDFKLDIGDTVYYIQKGQVKSTYVYKIELNYTSETPISNESIRIHYYLRDAPTIEDEDINTIYFTDKKELIQHLVAQL